MERDGILNLMDQCDLDALRYAYLPAIQRELDMFREAHNKGYKRGRGKPIVLYNRAEPERECDIELQELHIPTRLPFTTETLAFRDRLVESMAPRTLSERYRVALMANKLLLQELLH